MPEIIRLVEYPPLPVRDTMTKLGILRATFYRYRASPGTGVGVDSITGSSSTTTGSSA